MTRDTPNNLWVKVVIVYVVVGLIAVEVPYFFLLCRPFSQYWAIEPNDPQCANYHNYCIIQMVFNISTDFCMLLLPLPFIIHARVPKLKRCLLIAIFSLGAFVILAAILNKYYNFSNPNTTVYMVWHIRECSTSIYVANIMCWWPLLRKFFGLKRFLWNSSNGTVSQASVVARNSGITPEPNGSLTPLTPLKGDVEYRLSSRGSYPHPWDEKSSIDLEVGEVGHVTYGEAM